uniref:Insulin-like peptide 2 n=1 Tax=Penaeus japonicus TaxID=27405 RepID=A0A8S0JB72_PENJP|nr:insulin-like peptide 2 [Penaeus japonicus]
MKIAVAVLLLLVCLQSGCSWMTDLDAPKEPQRRLCGWKLANKLNSVCKGVYNKPGPMSNSLYYRHRRGKTRPVSQDLTAPRSQTRVPFLLDPYSAGLKDDLSQAGLKDDIPREGLNDDLLRAGPSTHRGQPQQEASRTDAFDQILLRNAFLSSGVPFPFLTEVEAAQVFREAPRRKRGLSAECCRKACSVSELVDYCY